MQGSYLATSNSVYTPISAPLVIAAFFSLDTTLAIPQNAQTPSTGGTWTFKPAMSQLSGANITSSGIFNTSTLVITFPVSGVYTVVYGGRLNTTGKVYAWFQPVTGAQASTMTRMALTGFGIDVFTCSYTGYFSAGNQTASVVCTLQANTSTTEASLNPNYVSIVLLN